VSKYKPEALKAMAIEVLHDEHVNGLRSFQLYMAISFITGMTPNDVRERIQELA
jgi:hypothetical protein